MTELEGRHLHLVQGGAETTAHDRLREVWRLRASGHRPITHRACNGQGCSDCGGRGYFVVTQGRPEEVGGWPLQADPAELHSVRAPLRLDTAAARLLGACDALRRLGTVGTVDELLGREIAELDAAWQPEGSAS